ncbi:MAG: copper resistance protein NlpE N-terminal domain-containing protein [Fimbriimonadaceae bacterium]|nr:hypothetical protein [Chthonomonadaceae bacterium]MCO5296050.1 copper resistance protein NlpE N-terminal domain-containing protein [Fimbriimonadaceae bacterium]
MRCLKSFAVGMLVLGSFGAALGQSPLAGEWTGALTIEIPDPAKAKDAETAKMRDSLQAMVAQVKVVLTMRADGTFSLTATQPGKEKPDRVEGKWTLKADKLEMLTVTQNGVAPKEEDKKVFTVAKDRKSFSTLFDDEGDEMRARLTFTPKKPG